MNNGLFTYLAALLLFGSNGIIAAAIALPSSDIVLLRTFLGALSLVTILAITQRHKLQAPSRPREAAALLLSVADDRDGLDGQLGDGTKVEQATDAGVDDAEHDDGAPIDSTLPSMA